MFAAARRLSLAVAGRAALAAVCGLLVAAASPGERGSGALGLRDLSSCSVSGSAAQRQVESSRLEPGIEPVTLPSNADS